MASQANDSNGHLDATTGREVVYCHACSHEWYRDDHGLECPECGGDITEVIEPDNDPRDLDHHSSASTSPEPGPYRRRRHEEDEDDDPEGPDFSEYFGPNGFAFRRSVRDGPDQRHHNPAVDPVLERFVSMLADFRPPGPGMIPRDPTNPPPFTQGRIHRTTFSTGPFGGGTTSVTIVSGPLMGPGRVPVGDSGRTIPNSRGSPSDPIPPPDPFQSIFSNIVRDVGPPEYGNQGGPEGASGRPPPGFARSLHDILALFNPDNAMAGDAVYSQEALDRIITSLMEANPPSNAAPPATDEALKNLTRKPVDKEMLGADAKAECTICIDEMKLGETVVYLPCKHWFHEDCVVLWLKEHNTCPICRTPIEKNDRSSRNNSSNNSADSSNQTQNPGESSSRRMFPPHVPPSPSPGASSNPPWFTNPGFRPSDGPDGAQSRPTRTSRTPSAEAVSFSDALRQIHQERERREQSNWRNSRATATGVRYDTSRLQRRSSHSPTSPRTSGPEEHGARMRERSPSQSRWSMANRDQEQRRPSGHGGPFGWLRDRFGGGGSNGGGSGGSGNGSSRDERRQ